MNESNCLIKKPQSLGGLLDLCFSLYKRFFVPFIGLGLLAGMPSLFFELILKGSEFKNPVLGGFLSLCLVLMGSFLYLFGIIVIYKVNSQVCLGLPIDWKAALRSGRRNLLRITGASIVIGLWCGFGLFLVIPGIIAVLNSFLTFVVMLVEGLPFGDSWLRSKNLVYGFRWRIFFSWLAHLALVMLLIGFVYWAFGVGKLADYLFVAPWMKFIPNVLLFPLYPIFTTLLYFDLRVRKEALDLELQSYPIENCSGYPLSGDHEGTSR